MKDRIPLQLLIVDDDPLDREICRSLVTSGQRFNATITEAGSAREALEILSENKVDCLLLDNCLPDRSGTKALRQLNEKRTIPFPAILFTGHLSQTGYEEALDSGAYDLLIKGEISPESLERSIAFVLEKSAKAEAQQNALDAIREASELKSNFLAQVSHDIRNPMHQIMNLAKFLQRNVDPFCPKKQEDYVSRVRSASESILAYVNRLLDLAKMENGKMVAVPQLLSLAPFLEKIIDANRTLAEEKGIQLELVSPDNTPTVLYTDATFLAQIMNNLVSNAVKFTEKGFVRIKVSSAAPDHYLTIAVEDSGIGMEAAHLKKVFEPYIQASVNVRKEYGGSGLGLAIVKETVELLSGMLAVSSTPGEGSCFSITFPHAASPSNQMRGIPLTPENATGTPNALEVEEEVLRAESKNAASTLSLE